MIKSLNFIIICLSIICYNCTKQEVKQFEFSGDLNVKVMPVSEFGSYIKEKSGFNVTLEGTSPEISVTTDTSGTCVINNLPLGTYNLIISKEGFGTMKYQNFKFIGSDKPYNFTQSIPQKSSTKIKSYQLKFSGDTFILSGIISHHYSIPNSAYYPYYWPGMIAYLSNSPEVSLFNYVTYFNFYSDKSNDTIFNAKIELYTSLFPKGSTVYTIIYGRSRSYYSLYDYEKGIYYDPAMGDPSEVKSITLP